MCFLAALRLSLGVRKWLLIAALFQISHWIKLKQNLFLKPTYYWLVSYEHVLSVEVIPGDVSFLADYTVTMTFTRRRCCRGLHFLSAVYCTCRRCFTVFTLSVLLNHQLSPHRSTRPRQSWPQQRVSGPSCQWTLQWCHQVTTTQCSIHRTCDYRVCATQTRTTMRPVSITEMATELDCLVGVTLLRQMQCRTGW